MRVDSLLSFVPIGGNLSIVAGAGVSVPSPGIIDLLGNGVGVPPTSIIGTATVFGEDPGIGGFRPELNVSVGTTFTTSNAATLNVALQYAIDSGVSGGYQPGTWNTIAETGPISAANLTAAQIIARFPFLPAFPPNVLPRFIRLLFQVPAATNFTAGTIAYALVTLVRDDQANKYAARNYVVA